jgi:leader peptidase (prepilin peptidase)/N-methyltransferase
MPFPDTVILMLFGLMIGSFLNVVIHRLPIMATRTETAASRYDLAWPPSACPNCGRSIRPLENIPILSWLVLRGRCAGCGDAIPLRYPLVETAGAAVPLALSFILEPGIPLAAASVFCWFAIAICAIDLKHRFVPDALSLPLLCVGLIASLVPAFAEPGDAILGAALGYGALWTVRHMATSALGRSLTDGGNLKLFAAIGAWTGASHMLIALLAVFLSGALSGLVLTRFGRQSLGQPLPFGTLIVLAGLFVLIAGVISTHGPGN